MATCSLLYPFSEVLRNCIDQGIVTEDFFGYASAKDGDKYLGFIFGKGTHVILDESCVLIERDKAEAYQEELNRQSSDRDQPETDTGENRDKETGKSDDDGDSGSTDTGSNTEATKKKQFYGTVNLDPVSAKMGFATIVEEVVQQFTAKLGVDVNISIEIQANSTDRFDESLQRTIKENCNVLKFSNAEFED
jgi:hypothetical protein